MGCDKVIEEPDEAKIVLRNRRTGNEKTLNLKGDLKEGDRLDVETRGMNDR